MRICFFVVFLFLHLFFISIVEAKYKSTVWGVGLQGSRQNYRALNSPLLWRGNSANLGISYGSLYRSLYVGGGLSYHLGPYRAEDFSQDRFNFHGFGAEFGVAVDASGLGLRSTEGAYGFTLFLEYRDISARTSPDREALFARGGDVEVLPSRRVRVNAWTLNPGFVFSWCPPERADTKENLRTRIEGYMLTLAFAYPLALRYRLHEPLSEEELLEKSKKADEEDRRVDKLIQGRLQGFGVKVSLQAFFGV